MHPEIIYMPAQGPQIATPTRPDTPHTAYVRSDTQFQTLIKALPLPDGAPTEGVTETKAREMAVALLLKQHRDIISALLDYIDANTCLHEETHRGGILWTICDRCDRKWADDEGGFQPHEDAPAVAAARELLAGPTEILDRPAMPPKTSDISVEQATREAIEKNAPALSALAGVKPCLPQWTAEDALAILACDGDGPFGAEDVDLELRALRGPVNRLLAEKYCYAQPRAIPQGWQAALDTLRQNIRNPERGTALFIMLNPSTADASLDDPTIRRCRGFARAWGCAGLAVANLYALRATDPAELIFHPDPVGPDCDSHLLSLTELYRDAVCAWGANAKPDRVEQVVGILRDAGVRLWCLGTTKAGAPRHPLYIKADQELIPWQPA